MTAQVAVVGGGIVGLAHAYAAAKRGRKVVLFERHTRARGASVRNFGMVWPIGQAPGEMHALAMRSRELWVELLEAAKLPYLPTGSLHLAYRDDEAAVAREFAELGPTLGYDCRWLTPANVLTKSPALVAEGLEGALYSSSELTVDPRLIATGVPAFLEERYGVTLRYGCAVHSIALPSVEAGEEKWRVEQAIVCGGDDYETLYPGIFAKAGLTRCKLQMMRTPPQPNGWQLGPALAGGLTLRYYPTFEVCRSLAALKTRIARETPEYDRWGIHVMASQTALGEITIGDSHEYGLDVDIFDKREIDVLILDYLRTFVRLPDPSIAQHWHGVYAKHPSMPYFTNSPARGVRVVTVTSGIGMTLSFGLGEKIVQEMEST
jgi:FAD dependent oxidoreductase TIGR03364